MDIMFQLDECMKDTSKEYEIHNLSLGIEQGILRCFANNSFGNGSDEIKLYVTGKTQSI